MNRVFVLILFFLHLCAPAFFEPWGIVFSGGGGKGAYEVGVYKALCERGIAQRALALSGSSVGALNSALFVCEGIEKAEEIWRTIVPDELTKDDSLISQEGLSEIVESVNVSRFKNLASPDVYVTTVRSRLFILKLLTATPGSYAHRFLLNKSESEDEIRRLLLATSAFPILTDPVILSDGHRHEDGGNEAMGGDNTPIFPIIEEHPEVKKIIVVYLEHQPSRRIRAIDYEQIELVEIIPKIDLGGILEGTANFTSERINLLIRQGYEDASWILEQKGIKSVAPWWFEDVSEVKK